MYNVRMAGRPELSWQVRVRAALPELWEDAQPPASAPAKKPWTVELLRKLAGEPMNRDARVLLLFCEGGRSTVPGAELAAKFGWGTPFELARDLPRVAAFCEQKSLPSPIVASGGTAEKPSYALAWSHDQAETFLFALPS